MDRQNQESESSPCVLRVARGPLPPMADLEALFSEGGVSREFGENFPWQRVNGRQGEDDLIDEQVEMIYHGFGRMMAPKEAVAWGRQHGWLPADEREALAFGTDAQTRDFLQRHRLAALGAYLETGETPRIATLRFERRRRFHCTMLMPGFGESWAFLFARRVSR